MGTVEVTHTPRSTYFHTNLQHCSDIGRLAFLDAQKRMNSIRSIAKTMIAEEGRISYIIDLLEDIEDARYNLRPEMDALAKTAKDCQMNAEEITKKFAYWEQVIIHLKQASLTQKGWSASRTHRLLSLASYCPFTPSMPSMR